MEEFAIKKAEFITSVGLGGAYPPQEGAEIAIVGNAENFGREQTVVQYYDPAEREQFAGLFQRFVDALHRSF